MTEAWATERLNEWRGRFKTLGRNDNPNGVDLPRWRRFLNDSAIAINDGSLLKAIELGWDEYQLFGTYTGAPLARLDHLGVVWLIKGERIVTVTANEIRISTTTGSLSCPAREIDPAHVRLPWDPPEERSSDGAGRPQDAGKPPEGIETPEEEKAPVRPPDAISEMPDGDKGP